MGFYPADAADTRRPVDRVQIVGTDGVVAAGGGGGAATIADGADVAEGAVADAAAAAGAAGTISAKLRAISRDIVANIVLKAGTAIIGRVGHDTTGLGDGQQEVAAAGTAEALASTTPAKWVVVTAQPANTGKIAVGSSTVVAAAGSERGAILSAGDSVTLLIDDLAEVFVDATVTGEGASFVYGT